MNTALLLIEFQNDYVNGRTPLDKSNEASKKAQYVLEACRDRKLPIVHIQHISTNPDATSLLPCTKGAEFYQSVYPLKGEMIVKKHYPNSFKDTQLLNYLKKNNIHHLLICGMMTHLAVESTVRAAYDFGFTCTIIHDACDTKALEFNNRNISAENVHYAFLAALQSSGYAKIVSSDELLNQVSTRIALAAS